MAGFRERRKREARKADDIVESYDCLAQEEKKLKLVLEKIEDSFLSFSCASVDV